MFSILDFDQYNLLLTLLVSFVIQLIFFLIAFGFNTDKFTDLAYGLSFVIITLILLIAGKDFSLTKVMLSLMIVLWASRLVGYLVMRISHMKKDSRFDEMRQSFFKFGGFWLLQTISVWVIMLPVTIFLSSISIKITPTSWSIMWLGLGIWGAGLIIESVADWQKFQFKSKPENKDLWISSGLWQFSRHPNYLGEMLCWWGVFVFVMPVLGGITWLSVLGPVFITLLLIFVSGIPILEKKYNQKYANNPEYQAYKQQTSVLVPFV